MYMQNRYCYKKASGFEIEYTSKEGDNVHLKVGRFRDNTQKNKRGFAAVVSVNGKPLEVHEGRFVISRLSQDEKRTRLSSLAEERVSADNFNRTLGVLLTKDSQRFPYSELKYRSTKTLFRKNSGFKIRYKTYDDDFVRLYVGEFSERIKRYPMNEQSDKKDIREKFFGAILMFNNEVLEKYHNKDVVPILLPQKNILDILAESNVDIDEFFRGIELILQENSEIQNREKEESTI